jgi:anti-anti-sigma factor
MPEHSERGWSPRVRQVGGLFRRDLARHATPPVGADQDEQLTVSGTRVGDRYVVGACGELDLGGAWRLERELRRAEESSAHEILLDLGGLQFIDSIGMQVVIHASDRARDHGKRLMILSGPRNVHRAFELSGLATRLPFVDRSVGVPLP